jgi:tryptophanyl-tRNA synthetase
LSGNMAITLGLPDDEIDRLLLEAEARLSGNGSSDAVAVVPAAKTTAIVAAPVAPTAGEQRPVSENKSEKLTVRVPQLAPKQKVRAYFSPLHRLQPTCSLMKTHPKSL